MPREDCNFSRDFPRLTLVGSTTLTGVLALAVLADDDPIKIAGLAFSQRRFCPAEYPGGADVGILLQGLANS